MLPVQDHLSLICSQYLARALQLNNPFHSIVTSHSGIINIKQTLQYWFLHRVATYLSSGILPPSDYGTTTKFLHTTAVIICVVEVYISRTITNQSRREKLFKVKFQIELDYEKKICII